MIGGGWFDWSGAPAGKTELNSAAHLALCTHLAAAAKYTPTPAMTCLGEKRGAMAGGDGPAMGGQAAAGGGRRRRQWRRHTLQGACGNRCKV